MDLPKIGETLTNEQMRTFHSVSTQGGMRKSNKTNSLVLITSLESTYSDRWEEDTLHYTGEGLKGNQELKRQNKTLAESNDNGIDVFLYEKIKDNNYRFHGKVELAKDPYQESQEGEDGILRHVWMFPIRLVKAALTLPKPLIESELAKEREKLMKLSKAALAKIAIKQSSRPRKHSRIVTSIQQHRSPAIALCVKIFAHGVCDLCESIAPFLDADNQPYLECHHVNWLAEGGLDIIENTVALCPNCHRKMHRLNLENDRQKLKQVALARKAEIDEFNDSMGHERKKPI